MDSVIQTQVEKLQMITDEIDKTEPYLQSLRDKVRKLENEVFENKYVNQISSLTSENLALMMDVNILSYQNDLLTNAPNRRQTRAGQPPARDDVLNRRSSAPKPMVHYDPQNVAGPSGFCNRSNLLIVDQTDNLLSQQLPPSNQIMLQPCNIMSPDKSPPIPPRPKNNRFGGLHPSRSPPPPPPRTLRKWKCLTCTFENNENLNKCEMCDCARLTPQLGNIFSNQFDSLHALADSKRSSKPDKKWHKRK